MSVLVYMSICMCTYTHGCVYMSVCVYMFVRYLCSVSMGVYVCIRYLCVCVCVCYWAQLPGLVGGGRNSHQGLLSDCVQSF